MSIYEMSLDLKKSSPIYSDPIVLRQGDTNVEILVHVFDNSTPKNLENLPIEFHADKPDATTIDDDEQSHFTIGTDKESFTYTVPDELTDASGSTTNTYFKVGSDSTSNFYIHILTKAGMEKLESGDYISKVDRIFNHVMSDYSAINNLSETAASTLKSSLDKMNSDYVDFINSKNTEFKTYLAALDSQAADVKNKYTALKTQLDALEVPKIGGRNYLLGTETPQTIKGLNIVNQNTEGNYYLSVKNVALLFKNSLNAVISFDWVATPDATGTFYMQFNDSPWGIPGQNPITVDKNNLSGHGSCNFTESEDVTKEQNGLATAIRPRLDNFAGSITFSNVKLELGTIPTDWTPAPEDKANVSDTNDLQNKYTALQTQVNNSAVGTNLLTGTSYDLQTAPLSQNNAMGGFIHNFSSDELSILTGSQVTTRAFIHNTTTHAVNLVMWTNLDGVNVGTDVPAGTDGYSIITNYSIKSGNTTGNITIRAYTDNVGIDGVQYKELKLEKGSVATDWCPNPSEILAQSDYAKIKAAIVALGGSLS